MPLAAVIPAVVAGVGGAGAAATLGSAALGAGAAIYSSSQAKKASGKALDAQTAANDKALEEQRIAREQVAALQQPFVQGGYSALDAVLGKYNLGSSGGAQGAAPQAGGSVPNYGTPQGGAPAPQAAAGPQIDVQAYLAANPDIAKYYAQTPDAQKLSLEDFAKDVAVQQADVRGAPPMLPQQAAPEGPAPYVPEYIRPDQPEWQGAGAAPNQADYLDPSKFTTSPGYEFRLGEGNRNLNAKYGARGLLKSGGAIKGFTDYNQGAASAEYGNWFNQQKSLYDAALGQYNQDRSANYNIFNTERNNLNQNFGDDRAYGTNLGLANRAYDTGRDDTTTNNLFRLIGTGTTAAGATGNAASNYAANAGNIYGNQGEAAGNAAYGNAAANAQLGGALAGVGANLFNGAPRIGGAAANSNTSGTVNLGSLNYGSIFPSSSRVGVF